MYIILFSKEAEKDKKLLKRAGLEKKTKDLLNIIMKNPFQNPPPYEKLKGDLQGFYSRRINITHRLVYMVEKKNIIILRMWSCYRDDVIISEEEYKGMRATLELSANKKLRKKILKGKKTSLKKCVNINGKNI